MSMKHTVNINHQITTLKKAQRHLNLRKGEMELK
jgi:hypothetical protein